MISDHVTEYGTAQVVLFNDGKPEIIGVVGASVPFHFLLRVDVFVQNIFRAPWIFPRS